MLLWAIKAGKSGTSLLVLFDQHHRPPPPHQKMRGMGPNERRGAQGCARGKEKKRILIPSFLSSPRPVSSAHACLLGRTFFKMEILKNKNRLPFLEMGGRGRGGGGRGGAKNNDETTGNRREHERGQKPTREGYSRKKENAERGLRSHSETRATSTKRRRERQRRLRGQQ